MIERRPALLLNYLFTVKKATIHQVVEKTQLTKRQIKYDLDKINSWLKSNELPIIAYKGTPIIEIPEEVLRYWNTQPKVDKKLNLVLTEEERMMMIVLYLFIREEPISSYHFTQFLQVSKNTFLADVKKANLVNQPFLVEVRYSRQKGYHLKGTEFDKRVFVMNCLTRLLCIPYYEKLLVYLLSGRKLQITYSDIYTILSELENGYKLRFVEERIMPFGYFLLLYSFRQQEKKFVQFHKDEMDLLSTDPMWRISEELLGQLQYEQSEAEVSYFTIQLLGLSLGDYPSNESERDILYKICEQLVVELESKACIVFEKKDQLIRSLYQHFKPAYFRMKYRIPIMNPLLQQIKTEHQELYTIVKEMLVSIGTMLNITIPEEEIGFITIHFGALMEKPKQEVPKKKRAVVVCPSGVSSSLMVKHQIESLFSEVKVESTESLQEFKEGAEGRYDLVFSTVLLDTSLPCFYVKPIMTPEEKNVLVNEVYQHLFGITHQTISVKEIIRTIGQYASIYDEKGLQNELSKITFRKKVNLQRGNQPVLQDLLTKETVQLVDQVSDWEEAVQVAARPLLNTGAIEYSYVEAMIDNIKTLGPYVIIGPEVAIPHARPESGVNEVGMSFLKLQHPVYFLGNEDYPVRLLFCIAAIDNSTHLKALAQLTKLLSEKNNIEILKQTTSTTNIFALFEEYSKAY